MLLSLLVLRMIVLVPDHCVSFYFTETSLKILWYYRVLFTAANCPAFYRRINCVFTLQEMGWSREEKGVDGEGGLIL